MLSRAKTVTGSYLRHNSDIPTSSGLKRRHGKDCRCPGATVYSPDVILYCTLTCVRVRLSRSVCRCILCILTIQQRPTGRGLIGSMDVEYCNGLNWRSSAYSFTCRGLDYILLNTMESLEQRGELYGYGPSMQLYFDGQNNQTLYTN